MKKKGKRAVILAGGKGSRLKPYTIVLPKPLMPIGDLPILEVVVRQLIENGFSHLTMAVNHQADIIKAFFGDGKRWGVKIDYSLEDKPLGTMGPLKLIKELPDDFLVMNGDVLTDLNFSEFLNFHIAHKNKFTISSHERKVTSEYGVLKTDDHNCLIGFQEKPVSSLKVSMGVYAINKSILSRIADNTPYGFDSLMLKLIKAKQTVAVKPFNGYWLDIGRPDDYAEANDIFNTHRSRFLKKSLSGVLT